MVVLVGLAMAGLGAGATSAGAQKVSADGAMQTFGFVSDQFFADVYFKYGPTNGTSAGLHQYDAKLEDYSAVAVQAEIVALHEYEKRVAAIDASALDGAVAADRDILLNNIKSDLLSLEVIRGWEKNPDLYSSGITNSAFVIMERPYALANTRLRALVEREKLMPQALLEARKNLKNPPKIFTEIALEQIDGDMSFFENDVPGAFFNGADGAEVATDAATKAEFAKTNTAVIAALKSYGEWMKTDLLPRSNGDYRLGADTFAKKLSYDEMVDMPLPDLLARGEAQLAKDHAAFLAVGEKVAPGKSPQEVVKVLSDDHPTEDGLLPAVAASVEEARQFAVAKDLITFPSEVRVRVTETPPYERNGGSASMDTPGPFEKVAKEAFYYVTPVEKDWDAAHKESHLRSFNRPVMAATNIHEAYPGHYTQFLYAPLWPTKARKLIGSGTNVEGWAHYTEEMMVDQGFGGGDPKIRLGQLSDALLRDCRYVVGIKLHTQGMTVAQGAKIFEEQCFQQPSVAFEESRRGAYNPTYLYYTLGKLLIQDLAVEYREKKHATLKQFHNAFVSQGGLPIPLVRKLLLKD